MLRLSSAAIVSFFKKSGYANTYILCWLFPYSGFMFWLFTTSRNIFWLPENSSVIELGVAVIIAFVSTFVVTQIATNQRELKEYIQKNIQIFSFNLVFIPSTILILIHVIPFVEGILQIIHSFMISTSSSPSGTQGIEHIYDFVFHLINTFLLFVASIIGYFLYRSYTKNSPYAAVKKMRSYSQRTLQIAVIMWLIPYILLGLALLVMNIYDIFFV